MKFITYSTLFITALFSIKANAVECNKHPIYCQIVSNRPSIERSYAFKLSNIIAKKTRKYKINSNVFTAILAQESMYRVGAKNCTRGLRESDVHPKGYVGPIKVCTDFGIGQIYYKTANSHDFNLDKLTTDMDYSVEAAAIVLTSFKKRYGKKESDWWTRYNASNRNARTKYKALVKKFTNK